MKRDQGLGFKVWGLGYRLKDAGLRSQGLCSRSDLGSISASTRGKAHVVGARRCFAPASRAPPHTCSFSQIWHPLIDSCGCALHLLSPDRSYAPTDACSLLFALHARYTRLAMSFSPPEKDGRNLFFSRNGRSWFLGVHVQMSSLLPPCFALSVCVSTLALRLASFLRFFRFFCCSAYTFLCACPPSPSPLPSTLPSLPRMCQRMHMMALVKERVKYDMSWCPAY